MSTIEASRDLKALESYMPKFIEHAASQAESGLATRRRAKRLAAAVNPKRIESLTCSLSTVPYAYELWIAHLGWLDQMAVGVQFTLDDLRPEEVHGLALLRRAREKFWQEHRTCPVCNTVNLKSASFCGGCGTDFK